MRSILKHTAILAAFVAFSAFTPSSASKSWKIDKSHASVNFSVNHFFSAVTGKFKSFEGDFDFDPENPKDASFAFKIDVNSVNTDEEKRDNHLQSEDFFNAEKWPHMSFKSTNVEKTGKDMYAIKGKLTIRDVTKDVTLPMKITGMIDNPWQEGAVIMGIQIKTTINRTEYGVGTGSWAATAVVGDEVEVLINMELDGKK